jgi:hypothetical protein
VSRFLAERTYRAFIGVAAAAVAARLVVAVLFPPLLDVYYYDVQAVSALLQGVDPYGHLYVNIPGWLATPGAERVFAYLPGVIVFLAPFGALGDVRAGLVAADLLVAWGVFITGGRRGLSLSTAYLLMPFTVLFSTLYPNNTLVAVAFIGLSVVCEVKGRSHLGPLLLGLALASSQFAWMILPLYGLYYLRRGRLGALVLAAAIGVAVALPFYLWGPSAFASNTLFFEFGRGVKPIVSPAAFGYDVNPTMAGVVMTLWGATVPLWVRVAATLCVLAVLLPRVRDMPSLLLFSSLFLVAVILLLPNDFSWWYLELPFLTLLQWFGLTSRTAANP